MTKKDKEGERRPQLYFLASTYIYVYMYTQHIGYSCVYVGSTHVICGGGEPYYGLVVEADISEAVLKRKPASVV